MVKRAPVNVRYLWLFGEHILTRSFTARDPKPDSPASPGVEISVIPPSWIEFDLPYTDTSAARLI